MTCHKVQSSLSAYCDDRVSEQQRQDISLHLAGCRSCTVRADQVIQLRAALRGLPTMWPPSRLTTSLLVLASRERARMPYRGSVGAWLVHWAQRALCLDDVMRPVAMKFAGGLISAVVLFGILFPTFASHDNPAIRDVPTMLSTEASFASMGPFGLSEEDIIVDLTVDQQGRMIDYSTPSGQRWVKNPEIRKSVENALLFTAFTPGTTFGQPASGKIRITLRRSQIDVKG